MRTIGIMGLGGIMAGLILNTGTVEAPELEFNKSGKPSGHRGLRFRTAGEVSEFTDRKGKMYRVRHGYLAPKPSRYTPHIGAKQKAKGAAKIAASKAN